jgi:hypothetical protein
MIVRINRTGRLCVGAMRLSTRRLFCTMGGRSGPADKDRMPSHLQQDRSHLSSVKTRASIAEGFLPAELPDPEMK